MTSSLVGSEMCIRDRVKELASLPGGVEVVREACARLWTGASRRPPVWHGAEVPMLPKEAPV
eukprot:7417402-Prorocentrum_lima.AAC.1